MNFYNVECTCNTIGTLGGAKCAHDRATGHCNCKPGIGGTLCDKCEEGYWGFGQNNDIDVPCKSK